MFAKDGVAVFHQKVVGEVLSKLYQNFQETLYSNNDLSIKCEKDNLQVFQTSGTVIQKLLAFPEFQKFLGNNCFLGSVLPEKRSLGALACFNFSDQVRNKNSLVGGTPDALNTLLPSRPCCFLRYNMKDDPQAVHGGQISGKFDTNQHC